MGLTCSLLGHAFEDSDVEREREEQGSEVVTVVREVEECARCGERRVVSENKEVTTVVEPDEVGLDEGEAAASTALADTVTGAETGDDAAETETEGADADAPEVDAADGDEDAESEPTPEPAATTDAPAEDESEFEPPADPSEEDAEILGDETPSERRPGQWPDDEGGFEPEALTGGAPAVEGDTGADVVEDAAGDDAAEPEPADRPEPAATSVPTGDYVCPECGFSTPAAESSLREGDSCPECRRGYLAAR